MLAPPGPGHLDSGVDAARPVEHLDGVSQMEQPHRTRDLVAPNAVGYSLGVPAREDLPERIAHLGRQPEPPGHLRRGQAVRHEPPLHRPASGQDQIGGQAEPVQEGGPRPGMAQREPHQGQASEIDTITVAPEGDVIAKPGRHFRGVGHTAHPRQHHHVIKRYPRLGSQVQAFPKPYRNQPGPQYVLHRLAQPQVGCQRERGHQLRQPQPRILITRLHAAHARRRRLAAIPGTSCQVVGAGSVGCASWPGGRDCGRPQ